MSKSYKFPSGITFTKSNSSYVAKYEKDKKLKYELDIWAIAYALSDAGETGDVHVEIDVVLPSDFSDTDRYSLYLRHYFLKTVLPNVSVSIDGTIDYVESAEKIIADINNGMYITYSNNKKGPKFLKRGTKDKLESQVEAKMSVEGFGGLTGQKRQWPANIFEGEISKKNRKTRTRWIDMVAIDGVGRLSAVEIKAGENLPLDLFVQNFDYMIYLHLFKAHIFKEFFDVKGLLNQPVCGYFVTERMHPLITEVLFVQLRNTSIFNFETINYSREQVNSGDFLINEIPSARIGL